MSQIKARYTGPSETGVDLTVELETGELRPVHVAKGGELPTEVAGTAVSAKFRDNLLSQADWSEVKRKPKPKPKPKPAAPTPAAPTPAPTPSAPPVSGNPNGDNAGEGDDDR